MNTLNLITPEKSTIGFERITFPDGQPHIKLNIDQVRQADKQQPLIVYTRVASPADLLLLLFLKNSLDYLEFDNIQLCISYLMAARMDRVMLDGEPFSLKVVAQMINSAGFKKISIFDPHSEVTTALTDRSYAISNHQFVKDAIALHLNQYGNTPWCIVAPDGGALKKIHKLAAALDTADVVEGSKERDLKTGRLTGFKINTNDLSGKTCFIIDDICDGGGTFAGTAQILKEKGAVAVVLVVSHGIFSKGTTIAHVDHIYTTDSYRLVEGVECMEVMRYLG